MFERNQEMTKRLFIAGLLVGSVLLTLSGCKTQESKTTIETQMTQEIDKTEEVEVDKAVEEVKEPPQAEITKLTLRINCGATESYTDKAGNTWLADQSMDTDKEWGAIDGLTVDRGDLGMTDTDAPKVYETERYSMEGYKFTIPNGKYTVRLHFAETYDGITAEGERVFSVSINGQMVIEDFDPFKEAGGYQKPVVKTIEDVTVNNGELAIGFTMNIQNPEINGIEIISE
jgi:endoglucanase